MAKIFQYVPSISEVNLEILDRSILKQGQIVDKKNSGLINLLVRKILNLNLTIQKVFIVNIMKKKKVLQENK